MSSPLAALAWEIWLRGRRSAGIALGCLTACALVNWLILGRSSPTSESLGHYSPFFGLLMVFSSVLLMGIFNYTEYTSCRDWNGFPYRLFVLPVPTWQIVAVPMGLGVMSVEAV